MTTYFQRRSLPLLLLALMGACRAARGTPAEAPGAQPAIGVRLAPVTDTTIVQPVTASGVLGAKEEVPLGFKIGGVVRSILVNAGDQVRAGQLLASLELPEIEGGVAKAEAALGQAERDLTRAEALYRDSVIPRSAWEGARTAAEVARADAEVARFNRRYATIMAPSAGTILARYAEPGQQIAGGTPLLLLASAERGQVLRVGLPDRDVVRVAPGDRARVRFAASGDAVVTGRVSQIAAQASPGTGTWSVEIRLDRAMSVGGALASGLIGAVEVTPRRAEPVRLIPISALLEGDGDSAAVYIMNIRGGDTLATRRMVRVAFLQGESAAVRDGLEGIDEVITDGSAYLADGGRVHRVRGAGIVERGGR
jgi:membrane fusion protein, multidrug efflux system